MNNQLITTKILKISLPFIALFFWLTSVAYGAPNSPSDVSVVPRYEATISLIITWSDNSADETGFEIARRAQGEVAFSPLDTVGVDIVSYQDNTATDDQMWEYQVRALGGPAGDSAWTAPSNASSPRIQWPVDDGSHNILHNYGNPLGSAGAVGNLYYHDGVDFANEGQINAARGGRLASVSTANNGSVTIEVDAGAAGTYRDIYAHLYGPDIGVVAGVNDELAPGETLATSLYDFTGYGPEANHLHWETDLTAGGGKISVLSLFSNDSDQDPQTAPPVVADVNDDSDDFIVVDAAANNHSSPREPAWGDVDFLVDAYDDMSTATDLVVSPQSLGYWIQPGVSSAESVRNSGTPYRLIAFDQAPALCGSPCSPESIAENALYDPLPADLHGIDTWQSYYTWIITNTRGTDGDPANIDANQFWRTDARSGTGAEPNGSDASRAREIQEARFPDGTYFAHIILNDLVHTSDRVRPVLVDNSRPYVKRVTVYSGLRIVYQALWVWDGAAAQLQIQPATFDAAAPFTALRTQDVTVEVEFSEPMQTASITDVAPLGVVPTLASTQPAHARTIWRGLISNLDIADDGSDDGTHMFTINGTDLAGNALLQVANHNSMGPDHHNRDGAGNLRGTTGVDTIHGFKIGPLSGVIPVTAIFLKQTAEDPVTTSAAKALALQTALNNYYDEVSYAEISFAVTGHGWYRLDNALNWYYTSPQTPLIDLVQEAVTKAQNNAVDLSSTEYVLVVTDEDVTRDEWSTNGAWPYDVSTAPGWQLMASGTLNLASTDPHVTNLAGRMVGLMDLFPYPEVIAVRDFVGPWSHMSDKDRNVHVMGWEKWRVGWLDETGTTTGKTLTRVAKPAVGSPITNATYTLTPMDDNSNTGKMVAIEIGDRLHYTVEYRRQQNLDTDLTDAGVLIVKTNDYINQGEGTAIVQESPDTIGDLNDATFTLTAPRERFTDVGSGVDIEVITMNANQAEIRLNYDVPATENDVFVSPHDRWKAEDIWIDAPDLAGNFEADPLTVKDTNEKPVVGEVNKVYGRIRNQGHADATNFETHLEIREPWGAGGPWRSLKVETIPLLQGQDTNSNAYQIISAEWTPIGDIHSCVKLNVNGVANDVTVENNWTQENISEFTTTTGSPYAPVTSRFSVENPYSEDIIVLFKLDGLPSSWSYMMSPSRLIIPANAVGDAQVIIQPNDAAPICSKEEITVNAYTPRVDTLKQLGGITLNVGLKNPLDVTANTFLQCGAVDDKYKQRLTQVVERQTACAIYTEGCIDPGLPNTRVAVVYTTPDGSKQVRYVTTDANGCYLDILPVAEVGLWQTQVVVEETDCREEAKTPQTPIVVGTVAPCAGSWWCCVYYILFILAVAIAIISLMMLLRGETNKRITNVFIVALIVTGGLAYLLFRYCNINVCWIVFALVIAILLSVLFLLRRRRE